MYKQIKRRPSAAARGYGPVWQKYSKAYRQRHIWCVSCLARNVHTPVQCVDHIVAAPPDDPLFWDETNHQALCASCHSIKTVEKDRGFGITKRAKIYDRGCDATGRPLDDRHPWNK